MRNNCLLQNMPKRQLLLQEPNTIPRSCTNGFHYSSKSGEQFQRASGSSCAISRRPDRPASSGRHIATASDTAQWARMSRTAVSLPIIWEAFEASEEAKAKACRCDRDEVLVV